MGAGASSTKDVLQQNDPGRVPERSPSASDMTEAPTSKTTPSLAAKSTPALGSGGGSAGPKKQAEIDDDNIKSLTVNEDMQEGSQIVDELRKQDFRN